MKMPGKQANVKDWFQLNQAVWDHPFEKEPGVSADKQKLLMLALVKFADGCGESCHPGQTRLAAMSGQSPSSVKRCLKLFRDNGFVAVDRRWATSNAYTISEDKLREATTMTYLCILFFLAAHGGLTKQVMGHISRTVGPFDAHSEVIQDSQPGHGYDLLTTSIDLPKVELPEVELPVTKVTSSTANSFAIASHKAKLIKDLVAEQRANNTNWLPKSDGAVSASGAPDDTDLVQELENQFLDKADSVAFSLAARGASIDDIVDDLKLLLCRSDPRVRAEISESDLEGVASWALKIEGPKIGVSLST